MKGGASAAQTALGIGYTLNESHTHTLHTRSGLFRVLVWFGAYHYPPLGEARLTELDWHCQELSEHTVGIYVRAPSCFEKGFFFFFAGKSLPCSDDKESVGPVDRLRTAACNENKSVPIETERFLSTLERSRLLSPRLVNRLWLKIEG